MRSSNPDFRKFSADSCSRQLVLLNRKSCIRMLLTNFACFTERKERLHEYSLRQLCYEFENDDSHIPVSLRSFDDKVREVCRKPAAQKTSKKRGRYFGSHALVFCSFGTCQISKAGGGRDITSWRGRFRNTWGCSCVVLEFAQNDCGGEVRVRNWSKGGVYILWRRGDSDITCTGVGFGKQQELERP